MVSGKILQAVKKQASASPCRSLFLYYRSCRDERPSHGIEKCPVVAIHIFFLYNVSVNEKR